MTTFDVESDRSQQEGRLTSEIEQRTASIPSVAFLTMAGVAVAGSLSLFFMGRREDALCVGQWAPTLLLLGLYNKLVKQSEIARPITSGLGD
jgi:hypothetical protein